MEVAIRHFLFLFKHAQGIHKKHSAYPLNAVNGDMVLGILVLLTISEDVPIIADWAILRSRWSPAAAFLKWFLIHRLQGLAAILFVGSFWNFFVCDCVSFSWLWTFNLCIIFFIRDHFNVFFICIRYVTIITCLILGCMCIKLSTLNLPGGCNFRPSPHAWLQMWNQKHSHYWPYKRGSCAVLCYPPLKGNIADDPEDDLEVSTTTLGHSSHQQTVHDELFLSVAPSQHRSKMA